MELLVVALAIVLSLAAGYVAGVARASRLAARRAMAGASSALAAILPGAIAERTPAEILAGIIPIRLGGERYELPVKSRRQSREWLNRLDERFTALGAALSNAETPEILRALLAHTDDLYAMLEDYAGQGVIPVHDSADDFATDAEILHATLGVWSALHPLAVALVVASETNDEPPTSSSGISPAPRPRSPKPTAGARATSMTS